MIHSVIPTSCIKGNPVRNRNSARYCKATLLRLLVAATEHTETFFKTMPLSYRRLLVRANISLSHRRPGTGRCGFRRAESGNLPGQLHSQRLPGVRKTSINLTFSINENQLFIGSHTVLPDTPAPCPNRIERKGGERRHERASCRGKYPRRQQSDGMHHQRKGEFIIDNLPDGQHTLRFSYIGFTPKNTPRTDKKKTSL